MGKGRLEAFSDGVIAIIITIMVLEMKVPHDTSLAALWRLAPVFGSYVLSFIFVGIYWNNHHHLLHATKVDRRAHPVGQPHLARVLVAHHGAGSAPRRTCTMNRLPLRVREHMAPR